MMLGGAITNALAFTGSNFLFSQMASSEERARHDRALEKLQHDRDAWNEARLQRIDYINQKLKDQGHAEQTFKNADEAMRQLYLLTGERLDDLPPEPHLYDMGPDGPVYLDEDQKAALEKGELAIISVGMIGTGLLVWHFV